MTSLGDTNLTTEAIVDLFITECSHPKSTPAETAAVVVARLQELDPEVLDEWLYDNAEMLMMQRIQAAERWL